MAGMCCGINVGENEPTSPVEPATRTARRRRMELRQIKFIAEIAETTTRLKRRKVEDLEAINNSPMCLQAARECESFITLNIPAGKIKESPPTVTALTTSEDLPTFGYTSVCGRRRDMEDSVTIRPSFYKKDNTKSHGGFHFYGVYDGHGCSHVAKRCKKRMHEIIKEEIEKKEDEIEWTETMSESFKLMDSEVGERSKNNAGPTTSTSCRCELQTPQCDAVGSTAVVSVVTPEKIVVSNCGDSRAVLCRKGVAIPLSSDHKPDRPDELNRIEEAGGRVIYWDGPRVLGMLAMSRAIGDNYLKPYVIPDPEVTITDRTSEDECLILASDGLWDVVSNETAVTVARMCLLNAEKSASPSRSPGNEAAEAARKESSDKACSDASVLLTKLALARQSADNVSVVVVDLRKGKL
ncbi:protein phosphatase 2C 37 [Spinacia oleracea]|uniref:protein-serine/threonine phosphatase n=1 Tax=Spinacia oleracea TaxID=3562 RepID=A0A9R0IAE8_SPIOL|nr:protein phosphatase 2C 37-like [Spinacia oleracea]